MRLLKETLEIRANSEIEAKEVIESYRQKAATAGFTIKLKSLRVKSLTKLGFVKLCKTLAESGRNNGENY